MVEWDMADVKMSGGSDRGLYKPGCLFAMLPGILVLVVVGFGAIGGWSIGILVTLVAAATAIFIIGWFVNRNDRKEIREEPPPPYNPGSDYKEGSPRP